MKSSFNPPVRTLMGPGPSDVSPRVLSALARPTIGHLDPEFIHMMDEIKEMLQALFKTQSPLTLPVSAPGSAGFWAWLAELAQLVLKLAHLAMPSPVCSFRMYLSLRSGPA